MKQPIIGIIGGGQLAQMLAQAAISLGQPIRLLAEGDDVCAAAVVPGFVVGDYTDPATVFAFAEGCDAITFDHEHVPPVILAELQARGVAVRPGPDALIHAQDKAIMRQRLTALGIPCPTWCIANTPDEMRTFGDQVGWPIIAKASRGGYDGHGVWKLNREDVEIPFAQKAEHAAIIAEEFVPFVRELSIIVCRGADGQAVAYPVSESVQADGVCVETITPAPDMDDQQQEQFQAVGLQIAQELGVVGLLTVEMMQRENGTAVVNELAMRPHNTGHWTQDGAVTSQFENHLRAVAGLPLGSAAARGITVMHNIVGGEVDAYLLGLPAMFADPDVRFHWYGKGYRKGRKLGHVNVVGCDVDHARDRADRAAAIMRGE